MPRAHDVQAVGDRVEALLAELTALGDPAVRATAEELVRTLVELYGAGLDRVMRIATEAEAAPVLRALADDDLVCGLLVLHDLHPLSTAERVDRALAEVRPKLGGHGGDVRLVAVDADGGVVRLRLEGAGHGCPSSRATVVGAVERAIMRAAPEISRVDVEEGEGTAARRSPLLQIQLRPPGTRPAPEGVS